MFDIAPYLDKTVLVVKFIMFLAMTAVPVGWLAFKMMYNLRAVIIDRRDSTGRIITSTSARIRKDKEGQYYIQLWSGGRVDNAPNELIYHTKKDLFKKGLIIVNKIGEASYAMGKLEDMRTVRMLKPVIDEEGKPTVNPETGEYVMEEQEHDIIQNIIQTYEPTLAFIRREAKRDIERHQSKNWWKENASIIVNVAMVGLIAFMFLMGVKYDAQRSGAHSTAIAKQAESNEALARSLISIQSMEAKYCGVEMVVPEEFLKEKRAEVEAEQAKEAGKSATNPVDWLKK